LRQELERAGGDEVALDLSAVDYVDPVALGVVLAGSLRVSRRGGRFVLVCPPGRPRELLAETGVDRIVEVVDTLDDLGARPSGPPG
jgi:anti-anti-sigma factor